MKRYRYESPAKTKARQRRDWPFWWPPQGLRCQHCNTRYKRYAEYLAADQCSYKGTRGASPLLPTSADVRASLVRLEKVCARCGKPITSPLSARDKASDVLCLSCAGLDEQAVTEQFLGGLLKLGKSPPVQQLLLDGIIGDKQHTPEEIEAVVNAVLGPAQPDETTMIGGLKARTFTWAPPATEAEARVMLERGSITHTIETESGYQLQVDAIIQIAAPKFSAGELEYTLPPAEDPPWPGELHGKK